MECVQPVGARILLGSARGEPDGFGLDVPDTANEKPQRGEIVRIGDDTEAITVSVGDRVLFPMYIDAETKIAGVEHLILESADSPAIRRDGPAGAAA